MLRNSFRKSLKNVKQNISRIFCHTTTTFLAISKGFLSIFQNLHFFHFS
eukprot:UN11733